MEEYSTASKEASDEFTERRSRFIGSVKPVRTEEEADEFIRAVRAANREAKHNVFAYILRGGRISRCSDDGEPQGTAGVPVLNVLQKEGVTDTAIVVTRYFGGILLGTGGLVRAYSHAAAVGLAAAGIMRMGAFFQANLVCKYSQYGRVLPLIAEFGGTVDGSSFEETVALRFHLPCEAADEFQKALADSTCGDCSTVFGTKKFYKIS